ncbi:ATP-binding protein [Streptacidiphilus sp. N1-12]|uniref:ATP-binding protein n=2 Tax=Streptacidiphilus alkalitolerans TaxID=3342712 RepID=A0ABV6VGS0_9ACTN
MLVLPGGDERRGYDGDNFLLHADDLDGMRPTDLRAALKRAMDGDDVTVNITLDDRLDEDLSIAEPVALSYAHGQLLVTLCFSTDHHDVEEERIAELLGSVLRPYLQRNRSTLAGVELDPFDPSIWNITLACSTRGRDAAEMFRVGEGALALLVAYDTGKPSRETTLDLLRSGNAHVLIGQEEGPWLDVKADHYNLQTPHGKISIAQAVSRFANAENGGIVVVGIRGKKVPGGEIISSICPVPVDGRTLRQYQDAIEKYLYPPPDFLDIEAVPVNGGSLIVLHVPAQPEELKPFLVHGAIVDGRVEGAFISIVRRRGESSIPITAPAVHATLAAGRALLRRGELPKD